MRILFASICFLLSLTPVTFAQNDTSRPTVSDSDPEAIAILDRMSNHLKEFEGLTAEFTMTLMAPGTDTLIYEGTLDQFGSKYFIDVKDYRIISDGTLRWIYFRSANEANLYAADEGEDTSSPLSYLKLYKSGDYVARVADEYAGGNEGCVELKPLDRISEYIKVRLTIDLATDAPARVEVFERGGTRTDLRIHRIAAAANFPEGHFVFDEKDYPGVHLEDLRID